MQARTLYKQLGKLIEEGLGYKKVVIQKETFNHALESDGCVFLSVKQVSLECYPIIDDDGGFKEKANGEECSTVSVVLRGE